MNWSPHLPHVTHQLFTFRRITLGPRSTTPVSRKKKTPSTWWREYRCCWRVSAATTSDWRNGDVCWNHSLTAANHTDRARSSTCRRDVDGERTMNCSKISITSAGWELLSFPSSFHLANRTFMLCFALFLIGETTSASVDAFPRMKSLTSQEVHFLHQINGKTNSEDNCHEIWFRWLIRKVSA